MGEECAGTEVKEQAEIAAPQVAPEETAVAIPQRAWAERSRSSIRHAQFLEVELSRCKGLQRREEGALEQLIRQKETALQALKKGESEGWADKLLNDTLAKIKTQQEKLAIFTGMVEQAQANLDSHHAAEAARAPGRLRIQNYLATLAAALMEFNRDLEQSLRAALVELEARQQVIELMRREAGRIALPYEFDNGVYEALREALSMNVLADGEEWKAEFLGEEAGLQAYVVCDDQFEPKETLARQPIYRFGETVYLREAEARVYLRTDRPTQSGREWQCLPPTLMTAESFAKVEEESGRHGSLMKYELQRRHADQEELRRLAYIEERKGTRVPGAGR